MKDPAEALPAIPRTSTELLSHETAEKAFLDAWNGGRLAHSWLIAGPRGIGKATLAYRIARFVLANAGAGDGLFGKATAPQSLDMSTDDPVFRRIAASGHSDLKVLERMPLDGKMPSDIPVDMARTVGGFLSLTPGEGGWRVVIVDSLDELNRHGANALLKVIEEPSPNTLILVVTHSPGSVLATIRSRCRILTLQPLTETTIIELLGRHLPDLALSDRQTLARLSSGSFGGALALAQGGGLALYRDMVALLDSLPKFSIEPLHAFADKAGKSEDSLRLVSQLLARWLGDSITEAAKGDTRGGNKSGPVRAPDLDRWVELWEKTNRSFERAEAVNLDRRQTLLNAFLSIETLCRA